MIGIYKIVNPKGKIYIGQSINLQNRLSEYKRLQNCSGQIHLYNSLKKYGSDNHIFEILELCTQSRLNERERYWQDHYNVAEEGLNCKLTKCSGKSGKWSEEVKVKIKQTLMKKGYKHSEEAIQKIKKAKLGKARSDSAKNAISKGKLGKKTGPRPAEFIQRLKDRLAGIPKPRVQCTYCNKQGSPNNMKRWHFENCKNKNNDATSN